MEAEAVCKYTASTQVTCGEWWVPLGLSPKSGSSCNAFKKAVLVSRADENRLYRTGTVLQSDAIGYYVIAYLLHISS